MRVVTGVPAAVPAVHEQMQHGAEEEQHVRERTEHMRPMLRDEKEPRNSEKGEQDQPAWRPEPALLLRWMQIFLHAALTSYPGTGCMLYTRRKRDGRIDHWERGEAG